MRLYAQKKNKQMLKKIGMIEDRIRDKLIDMYFQRCFYRLKIRFIEWRLDYKLRNASAEKKDEEYDKIDLIKNLRTKIDKFLFLGVLLPGEEAPMSPERQKELWALQEEQRKRMKKKKVQVKGTKEEELIKVPEKPVMTME